VVFTEIKEKNGNRYYYRTVSQRNGKKVEKKRIYMGSNLSPEELRKAEQGADQELGVLDALLTEDELRFLDELQERFAHQPSSTFENRYEAFISHFTHDSTAIEGNTLTLQETASLLFDQIAPQKSLKEINEILNHKRAFDHLLGYDGDIDRDFILDLHRLAIKDTLREDLEDQVGRYRKVQVFIRGVEWVPAAPDDVPADMTALISWYSRNREMLHPLVLAVYFHVGFETIHPFVDGNGRVGRLLMNFILHKFEYPMVNIPNVSKNRYYDVLSRAQVDGELRPFIEFVIALWKDSELLF
jgi:Fic family protein